jgi:hypothetical protein
MPRKKNPCEVVTIIGANEKYYHVIGNLDNRGKSEYTIT